MKHLLIIWLLLLVTAASAVGFYYFQESMDAESEIKQLQIEKLNKEIKEMSVSIEIPEPPDVNDYMRNLENDLKLGGTIGGGGGPGGTSINSDETSENTGEMADANIEKAKLLTRIKTLEEKIKTLEAKIENLETAESKKSQDGNPAQD